MRLLATIVACLVFASAAHAELRGPVTHVYDGDTIRVGQVRVRIWGIDSPERGQPGWRAATRHMRRLALGKTATCTRRQRRLTRGRVVMQCWVNGRDLAMEMRCAGLAKDWPKYSKGYYAECAR